MKTLCVIFTTLFLLGLSVDNLAISLLCSIFALSGIYLTVKLFTAKRIYKEFCKDLDKIFE